jgi:hypothetical protein
MSNMPDGAQLSDDGQWWWDGENWQPVAGNANDPNSNDGTSPEASQEDVQSVNDSGTDPGDESKLDDKLKPYFQPDYDNAPDDDSWAEVPEALDDSQYTNDNSNTADSNSNANAEEGN